LHTREIVAKIHNSNVAKRSDIRTPEQLYPLHIDKELKKAREKQEKAREKQEKEDRRKSEKFKKSEVYKKKQRQLERILKKVHGK